MVVFFTSNWCKLVPATLLSAEMLVAVSGLSPKSCNGDVAIDWITRAWNLQAIA
jgi:hypothetical protein